MTDTSNILWGPVENFRSLVAASTTFQTLVGTTEEDDPATAAKAYIYCPGIGKATIDAAASVDGDGNEVSGLVNLRPFAVIGPGDAWDFRSTARDNYSPSGSLILMLEDNVAAANLGETAAKMAAAEKAFCLTVGDIVNEMLDAAAADTTGAVLSPIARVTLLDGPYRTDPADRKTEGDFYQIVLEFTWGLAG